MPAGGETTEPDVAPEPLDHSIEAPTGANAEATAGDLDTVVDARPIGVYRGMDKVAEVDIVDDGLLARNWCPPHLEKTEFSRGFTPPESFREDSLLQTPGRQVSEELFKESEVPEESEVGWAADEGKTPAGQRVRTARALPSAPTTYASPEGAGVAGNRGDELYWGWDVYPDGSSRAVLALLAAVANDQLQPPPPACAPEGPPALPMSTDLSPTRGLGTPIGRTKSINGRLDGHLLECLDSAREDTVIIFDWDDTLLCSSALAIARPGQLEELATLVEEVLTASMSLGVTLIVTNAHRLWVQDSAARFIPRMVPVLERLQIISARELHEETCPGDYFAWKRKAFCELLSEQHLLSNLIVLGDSLAEIQAAHHASNALSVSPLVKTVKFKESPSPTDLIGQLRAVVPELKCLVDGSRSVSKMLVQNLMPAEVAAEWTLSDTISHETNDQQQALFRYLESLQRDTWGQPVTTLANLVQQGLSKQDKACITGLEQDENNQDVVCTSL